jgi:Fic family protein
MKKEEVEQIDEMGPGLHGFRLQRLVVDYHWHTQTMRNTKKRKKWTAWRKKRCQAATSKEKLLSEEQEEQSKGTQKEEVEQIDGLSKSTLGSYVKKLQQMDAQKSQITWV